MKVRFTRPAQIDLQRIHTYVSDDNPAEASRLIARLIEHARALGRTPHEGRSTDEPNARVIVVPRLRYFSTPSKATRCISRIYATHRGADRPAGGAKPRIDEGAEAGAAGVD